MTIAKNHTNDTGSIAPAYRYQNGGYTFCGYCEGSVGEYVYMAVPLIGRSIGTCSEKCRVRAVRNGHSYSV